MEDGMEDADNVERVDGEDDDRDDCDGNGDNGDFDVTRRSDGEVIEIFDDEERVDEEDDDRDDCDGNGDNGDFDVTRRSDGEFIELFHATSKFDFASLGKGDPEQPIGGYLFNIQLRKCHILRLRPGEWLDDEIINIFIYSLRTQYPNNFYFPSMFLGQLLLNGHYNFKMVETWWPSSKYKFETRTKLDNVKSIFFPYNIRNTHWALVIMDVEAKEIQYLDSSSNVFTHGQAKIIGGYVLDWLSDVINRLGPPSFDKSKWKICHDRSIPQQRKLK
jgi:hypothetical protein